MIIIENKDIDSEEKILKVKFDNSRRKALKEMNNTDIVACAGSGKTTLMCAKIDILTKKQHLYMYIGKNSYQMLYFLFYIPLVHISHLFATFLLYFLVYYIFYYVSFLMCFLFASLYKTLYSIFS